MTAEGDFLAGQAKPGYGARELRRQGGSVYLKLHEDYNIFDRESGVNLLI